MRKLSVKQKLSLWLTGLMIALFVLLLVFTLSVSSSVVMQTAEDQLTETLRGNLGEISMTDGKLELQEGFSFYENGVTTLIYSEKEALLAGQVPVELKESVAFENGKIHQAAQGSAEYLMLDVWLPLSWEEGVWVRGIMDVPERQQTARNLITIALIALPAFILLAALGSWLIVNKSFRPLDRVIATAEDINEAKDLSGRIGLPPGGDEFSRLATTFDEMFERLETSFEAEKQFTADASHELRTPVAIIKGACDYSEKFDETPEEKAESLAMIRRQADRMTDLISQLLTLTRLDQGTAQLSLQKVDLGQLAKAAAADRGWAAPEIKIETAESTFIQGDEMLLTRLLENLVENALKYGRSEKPIRITVRQQGENALLTVADKGPGIAPEEQEKIWQRFYRTDTSRSDEESTGLGLAMVRQIARIHGGEMTLESAPGEGSRFTLRLPLMSW